MATWAAVGLIGLLLLHRQTGQLNDEINAVGRPARELVGEIQVAFSRRIYTLQEYLLTRDELYLAEYRREDAKLSTLNEGLVPLLTRLGIGTPADVVGSLFADWNSSVETMLVRGSGVDLSESAVVRDGLHSRTLAAISALRDEVNASIRLRLDRIRKLETLQVLIAISLAALALAAALERARLAGLERVARGEAERRAREEAALREAAAAVASARTVEETVRRIAESAVSSTGADAALVERIDAEQAEVEIVAKSGSCGPPVRERFNYAGSVSSRLAEAGGAVHWNSPEDDETVRLKRYVGPSCVGAKVLAVPLRDPERPLGSLILVRGSAGRDFDNDEAERLSIFGELAALEFRRITSLTESERQRRELERVTESRARLLRGFSHDVKNALGAADGYAQLLEDGVVGAPSEEQQVGIGRLRGSIGGALKLTEDLLHLARVEAGQIEVEWTDIEVHALVVHSVETYRPQAEHKGIEMTVNLDQSLPRLRTDPARVQQVLGNLISNAIKYTPGGGHVRVVARYGRVGDTPGSGPWVALSVIDDGPGIPPEQQSSVFEEFVRLAPEAGPGSGVGLAISRRVAGALNGRLTIRSAPGSGCEFTLWLPVHSEDVGSPGAGGRGPDDPLVL